MKIENLIVAIHLSDQLDKVNNALKSMTKFSSVYTSDAEGYQPSCESALYNVFLTQYDDGSGFSVDLTGCCVGIDLLKHTEELLLAKRTNILQEIQDL